MRNERRSTLATLIKICCYQQSAHLPSWLFTQEVTHIPENLSNCLAPCLAALKFNHDQVSVSVRRGYVNKTRIDSALGSAVNQFQTELKLCNFGPQTILKMSFNFKQTPLFALPYQFACNFNRILGGNSVRYRIVAEISISSKRRSATRKRVVYTTLNLNFRRICDLTSFISFRVRQLTQQGFELVLIVNLVQVTIRYLDTPCRGHLRRDGIRCEFRC